MRSEFLFNLDLYLVMFHKHHRFSITVITDDEGMTKDDEVRDQENCFH